MTVILLLCAAFCLMLACKQKKYPYRINGQTPEHVKGVWYADSFSYSRDTIIIHNSNGSELKILEPYTIYINEK